MQYMHFNSSCAFCCVANLLELQGKLATDIELFQAMKADILLSYEAESGEWQTGAMLQSGEWFNLALRPMGFALEEAGNLSTDQVLDIEPPFMVGLKTGKGGRHAHILMERQGDTLTFLNPHREGDGEPDLVTLTVAECKERLASVSITGRLISCAPGETDFQQLLAHSKELWHEYQAELAGFISQTHSFEEIVAARNPLFRAFFLDGLEGARICGHKEQAERLGRLQTQFLGALKQKKTVCLSEYLDREALDAAFAFYYGG